MKPENEADVEVLLSKDGPKRAQTESTAIHQQFVKSGFLMLAKMKGSSARSRKKRWCVLKENAIYFFASPKDRVADGYFDLDHCKLSFWADDEEDEAKRTSSGSKDANVVFFIVTPELEKYVLSADSEAEAKSWYTAVASRSATTDTPDQARVRTAAVSGYVARKARGQAT
jgi:hypothetical protein